MPRLALLLAVPAVLACPASASAVDFKSPSGNITCWIDSEFARCDIDEREWEPPPKPDSCRVSWGFGLTVGKNGRGGFVCAGGTAGDPANARVLRYGRSIERGRYRCTSKRSGMKCVNRRSGHGFKLSKQHPRRF